MPKATAVAFTSDNDRPAYEVIDITPDMAGEMLTHNTHNRPLRERVVNAYVEDMRNGDWEEDGQSIKFGKDGTLLDGQHRLAAIIESGVTLRVLVVRNLPNSTQENMDTQAKRTFGDVLRLRGETKYVALAAATRRVHLWEMGVRRGSGRIQPTNRQLLQTLEKYPWLRDSVAVTERVRAQVPIQGAVLALCHWLFVQIDGEDCDFFFARLSDGLGLLDGDPIHVLRKTAFKDMSERSRVSDVVILAYVIKSWNAYREGRTIGLLRYRPGGAKPEEFPTPI